MSACTVPMLFWKPATTPPGRPVWKIATRSSRLGVPLLYASNLGEHAGVEPGRSCASSGFSTAGVNCSSFTGCCEFQ